jgi:hypothetical protein
MDFKEIGYGVVDLNRLFQDRRNISGAAERLLDSQEGFAKLS